MNKMTFSNFLKYYRYSNSGAVAVEFALVCPLLLVLFFGLIELTNIIDFHRKVDLVASTAGDLSGELIVGRARESSTTDIVLEGTSGKRICALLSVASKNYYPFNENNLSTYLRYYNIDNPEWTVIRGSSHIATVTGQSLPEWFRRRYRAELADNKSYLGKIGVVNIHVEANYFPVILGGILDGMSFLTKKKDYWIFLRNKNGVKCEDCNKNYTCST